jgi:hypothetical protein
LSGKKGSPIDYFLGKCYAADVLKKGNFAHAKKALGNILVKGSAMEAEARKRIPQLEAVKKQCFISKKHLEYLNNVLFSKEG